MPVAASLAPRSAGSSKRHRYQLAASAALAPSLLLPLKAYLEILFPPSAPAHEMPAPNGYDILARLGGELKQTATLPSETATEDELRAFVNANRKLLDAARAALGLPHIVPVDYEANDLGVKQFSDLRQLSRAFVLEGDLNALDKKTEAAAQCYLDTIRLARVIDEGGLLIHMLIGAAVEHHGDFKLSTVRSSLSAETTRRVLAELQRLDAERDSLQEVQTREDIWQRRVNGWPGRLSCRAQGDYLQAAANVPKTASSKLRLLIYALAVRLYEAGRGQPPERLEQLAPELLRRLPNDPYSGGSPKYERVGAGYRLYSIGPDLDDDDGRPIPGGLLYGDGDFVLEQERADETMAEQGQGIEPKAVSIDLSSPAWFGGGDTRSRYFSTALACCGWPAGRAGPSSLMAVTAPRCSLER